MPCLEKKCDFDNIPLQASLVFVLVTMSVVLTLEVVVEGELLKGLSPQAENCGKG